MLSGLLSTNNQDKDLDNIWLCQIYKVSDLHIKTIMRTVVHFQIVMDD